MKRELGKEKVAFLRPYPAAARDPPGPWGALENPQCFANLWVASHGPWTAGKSQSTVNFSQLLPTLTAPRASREGAQGIHQPWGGEQNQISLFWSLNWLEGRQSELNAPQLALCVLRELWPGEQHQARSTSWRAEGLLMCWPHLTKLHPTQQNNCLLPWRKTLNCYRA